MIRRPPKSTLFPTTPLSRSYANRAFKYAGTRRRRTIHKFTGIIKIKVVVVINPHAKTLGIWSGLHANGVTLRSEEHTSELQSRQYLVCRLLLEKKKKNTYAR